VIRPVERFYNGPGGIPVPLPQVTDALWLSGDGTHLAVNQVSAIAVPHWTGQEDHEIDVFRRGRSSATYERRVRAHEQFVAAHLADHSPRSGRVPEGARGHAQVE